MNNLINAVAEVLNDKKWTQLRVLDSIMETMTNLLKNVDIVEILGFGTFYVSERTQERT